MKRVEEAARAAYARDVGSGLGTSKASSSSSSASLVSTPRPKPPPKPSDPYANYTTAASLGISDPEVDRYIIEAAARKTEGRAGEWTAVAPPPPPLHQESTSLGFLSDTELKVEPGENVGQIRKRDEEAPADDDDTRRFKIQKKTVAVGLGEIYDPGVIQIKPKIVKQEISADGNSETTTNGIPSATEKPKWVSRGWRRAGEPTGEDAGPFTQPENVESNVDTSPKEQVTMAENAIDDNVKSEFKQESVNEVKKEESTDLLIPSSSTADLFRKRKVPTASSIGRRKGR